MSDRQEDVLNVSVKLADVANETLEPETEWVADLGIDSPEALQRLDELEEGLGVETSDEAAAKMESGAMC